MLTNDLNSLEETERGKWNQISLQRTDKEINREGVKRREERDRIKEKIKRRAKRKLEICKVGQEERD